MTIFGFDITLAGEFVREAALAAGILVAFGVLAWTARFLLARIEHHLTERSRTHLDERLVRSIMGVVTLAVFLQGLFLATLPISDLDPYRGQIGSLWRVVDIALLAILGANLLNEALRWYATQAPARERAVLDTRLVGPLRRFALVAVYSLAAMLVLEQLGISVSPLLAGFGIGGLAVALALQPTLGNFFAGTYLVSDKVVSPGDFIELENGLRGYVVEVGWRSTRIRTPFNNLVIIPNSRLADSILTNFYGPTMEIGVMVEAGVSYSSDLVRVREVALETAGAVVRETPEAVQTFEPWFGYEQFGDSNIDFWVWVQARDRLSSFALKTRLIEELHARFRAEGIEINYPVRRLVFAESQATQPIRIVQDGDERDGGGG